MKQTNKQRRTAPSVKIETVQVKPYANLTLWWGCVAFILVVLMMV
jgi:hypothetical protein